MKKPVVNRHKTHKSPQSRDCDWPPRAGVRPPELRHGPTRGGAGGPVAAPTGRRPRCRPECRSRCRVSTVPRKSLNWTLRRYVRASSLRVWLRRHALEAGRGAVSAGWYGPLRDARRRAGTAAEVGLPATSGRPHGVSLCRDHGLRYRIDRNRQMEHLTQVAGSLRGGVRRGAAITARERSDAPDLVLTTLSNNASV
jgi:hypothetical protein